MNISKMQYVYCCSYTISKHDVPILEILWVEYDFDSLSHFVKTLENTTNEKYFECISMKGVLHP